jgi:hypothetical protein
MITSSSCVKRTFVCQQVSTIQYRPHATCDVAGTGNGAPEPVDGELLNWAKIGRFQGFDTMHLRVVVILFLHLIE